MDQGALVTSVSGEDGLSFWERSKNDVGEGLGEEDGLLERSDGEFVFAGFDDFVAGTGENGVYAEGMQLLLLRSAFSKRKCADSLTYGSGAMLLTFTTAVRASTIYVFSNGAIDAAS